MSHLLNHDHRCVLVQGLVDGDHLSQFHQMLDDFGSLDSHLVGQFSNRDGLWHVNFKDPCLNRCLRHLGLITVSITSAFGAPAPCISRVACREVASRFDFLFLGLLVRPTGRQFSALDLFAIFAGRTRSGCLWRSACARRLGRFMQGAFDDFGIFGRFRHFGLFLFKGNSDLLGRAHHVANRFSLIERNFSSGF